LVVIVFTDIQAYAYGELSVYTKFWIPFQEEAEITEVLIFYDWQMSSQGK